jgi:hypothetical protein
MIPWRLGQTGRRFPQFGNVETICCSRKVRKWRAFIRSSRAFRFLALSAMFLFQNIAGFPVLTAKFPKRGNREFPGAYQATG